MLLIYSTLTTATTDETKLNALFLKQKCVRIDMIPVKINKELINMRYKSQ